MDDRNTNISCFCPTGQERYGNMTQVYYREAVGALVVFDMTRLSTFQAVLKWKGDLDSKDDTNVDAAITCLVKTIIAAEEEKSTIDTARSDVIILPRLDCDKKEKGLGGCSGCPQVNPKTEEMTKNRLWI
ncbi:ras-related protein Rab-38-like isoform X1 [Nothobranchius furzeri]|uniref:ras-related protein Rab-38-like isoform X1 n=1 Tax=Nothobranchius furzeri TaxID=105023 RepID=UPI003904C0E8